MTRRRLTLKRIDPWSVLKFGFVANLSVAGIFLLGSVIVWFFVRRLELIEQVCDIAEQVGFESCGVNGGNLFRAVLLLGFLGVIVLTGIAVFLAFLHNLIADLVGGLTFTFRDDSPSRALKFEEADERPARSSRSAGSGGSSSSAGRSSSGSSGPSSTGTGTSGSSRSFVDAPDTGRLGSDNSRSGPGQHEPSGGQRSSGGSDERMFGDRSPGQRSGRDPGSGRGSS